MFSRYTRSARRVIFFARYEALRRGASQISIEHLLLGLVRDRHHAECGFKKLHDDRETIASRLGMSWQAYEDFKTPKEMKDRILPLADSSKRVLVYAAAEANRVKQFWIDTDFLLLGLLHEGGSPTQALVASGFTPEATRDFGREGRKKWPPPKPTIAERMATFPWAVWAVVGFVVGIALTNALLILHAR
jgi:ATP-dependent Clp protease ATP-binding subunit ClpA